MQYKLQAKNDRTGDKYSLVLDAAPYSFFSMQEGVHPLTFAWMDDGLGHLYYGNRVSRAKMIMRYDNLARPIFEGANYDYSAFDMTTSLYILVGVMALEAWNPGLLPGGIQIIHMSLTVEP